MAVCSTDIEELVVKVEPVYWENAHEDEMEVNVVPMVTSCRPHQSTNTDGCIMNHKPSVTIPSEVNDLRDDYEIACFPILSAQLERYTPVKVITSTEEVVQSVVYRNEGTLMDTNTQHQHQTVSHANFETINTSISDHTSREEPSFSIGPPLKNYDLVNNSKTKTVLDLPPHNSLTEVCMHCARVCKNKYALKSHMRIHDKEKWHKCPVCSKSFYKQSDLVRHTRLHTGDKPYVCEICGKSFSDPSYFRQHNRFHKGIKPYKCSFCNAAFTHKSHLTTHRRSHSGEKPFRCNLCEKTFGRRDYLKSHILTHNGVKSFHCSFCDKSFSKSSHLKAHVRSHTKEKPFGCDVCPSHFTRRSDVTRHRIRQHKGATRADTHP